MKKEMLKRQNLLFELHESEFIRFTIKDSDLIFRVAINCGVEEKLGVKIEQAEGEKCERCWMYSTTVGEDKENPTICHRCSEALK